MGDMSHIYLKLVLDALQIPADTKKWQEIYDSVFLAKNRGVNIVLASERVEFDKGTGHAYSPRSHESGGSPSRSMYGTIEELEGELNSEVGRSLYRGYKLDKTSQRRLIKLREDIKKKGLLKLLDNVT